MVSYIKKRWDCHTTLPSSSISLIIMDSRSLSILSSLRATAALSLVESQHAGHLESFELDAYVACNVARADTMRLYYELWTLRKIDCLSEFEVMWAVETPEGDVARASMIPKEAALQLSYTSLGAAEYRSFDLTRDWARFELTRLREAANLLPVGGCNH